MSCGNDIVDALQNQIGKTVTIFTTSGGLSGTGFTGVLVAITPVVVRLIIHIGAPPACPLGSACTGPIGGAGGYAGYGFDGGNQGYGGYGPGYNWLGSVVEIPIVHIAAFTHNAI